MDKNGNSNGKRINDSPPMNRQPTTTRSYIYESKWNSNLCDICNDIPTSAFSCLCYPCFTCCLASNARECGLTIVGAGCAPGLAMLRGKLRGRFRIEGSIIEDFVYSLCCPCCIALQMHKELLARGEITKL